MPIKVLMPALSPTMTEGTLSNWLKSEGDSVSAGDVIAEIETDKATMEVEAVDEGRLGRILVKEGTAGVPVNEVIAVLLEEGEDDSAIDAVLKSDGGGKTEGAKSESDQAGAGASGGDAAKGSDSGGSGSAADKSDTSRAGGKAPVGSGQSAPQKSNGGERIIASPLARRMAEQAGLDLGQIAGSGPHGRIVKVDVETALSTGGARAPAAAEAPAGQPSAAPAPQGMPASDVKRQADLLGMTYDEEPNSNMRKTIARRLSESKQSVPHFYVTVDCQLDELLKVRAELNARGESEYKLSVNDFVIRAVALALKKVPACNVSWTDEAILRYHHADVSMAVATPNGLITPVIRKADSKGLVEISNEAKELARKARDGKLKPEEYQGGTFSVSNMGMFGVREFGAIINPPQSCILAVGAGEKRAVVKDDALAIATVMSCTLSVDHRAVDGAVGAEFLAAFKPLIEDPMKMLL